MRFWEIDFFRGAAVVLMVFFNWSFALYYLGITTADGGEFFWFWFPRLIASMFIFISGISMAVSYSRNSSRAKHAKRGAKLLLLGMAITVVTYALFPEDFIIFGILHFIGAAGIISLPLMKKKEMIIPAALITFGAGLILQNLTTDFPYLLWLGLAPDGFTTLDYFPLLPWIGIFLMGIAAGDYLYAGARRRFRFPEQIRLTRPLTLLGRRSLLVYLVHQPLLIIILFILDVL